MKLYEYLKGTDQSVRAFARKCELSEAKIHFVIEGKREITLKTALIIEKMTNGDVPLIELCDEEFQVKIKKIRSPFKRLDKSA